MAAYRQLARASTDALETSAIPIQGVPPAETSEISQSRHGYPDIESSGVDKEEDKTSDDGLLEPGDDYELEDLSKPKKRIYEDDPDSPAAIVRKVVAETDDPTMTTLTFRVILLGTMLCILGAAISQLFFFKSNAPSLSSFFIILVSFPMGKFMARYLPDKRYTIFGKTFSLNPGPFSQKEHLLLVVLASSGTSVAYGADIIAIQDLYYHVDIGPIGGMLLLLTTQLIGFGLAGIVYDLLVRPTAMLWPSTLVVITLFNTLHGEADALMRQRLRFFSIAFLACFTWQFLPAVWAPTLTSIALLCILNNQSSIMRILGSGYSGYGLFDLSLDWSVIGASGGLYTPFWASLNYFGGLAINMWVIAPIMYFSNFWDSKSFDSPISARLYNKLFEKFDVGAIILPDLSLNQTAYEELKPLLLTPFFAISYGVSFAILSSAVVSVLLWNLDAITSAFSMRKAPPDIHVEILERNYAKVPPSWYWGIGGSMLLASIFLVSYYPLQLPVWGLFLALAIALFFLIPCGIIAAATNVTIGLNVITEFVAGFLLPGLPIANVTFKCLGYMTMSQALGLVGDLKLGLYAKIPPRHMFICQSLGTAIGGIVNYAFIKGVIDSKREYLDGTLEDPTGQWTGRAPSIFYSASVIWGLIGPARFFSGQYAALYLGFLVGAVLPLIPWFVWRRWPVLGKRYSLDKISIPLILNGSIGPPQIPSNILTMGFLSAYLGQRWALRNHPKWHEKYLYVLSAALDSATSVNALVIYIFGIASWVGPSWLNSSVDVEHCKAGS